MNHKYQYPNKLNYSSEAWTILSKGPKEKGEDMNSKAQLASQLKILKLSGILERLDLRLLEAQTNKLAYSEFLTSILLDEIENRSNNKVKRLLEQSNMGVQKTLESFDFTFNLSINATRIRELATCNFIDKGENIFFLGPTGTGKTHLAKAICHQACRKLLSVHYYKFTQFFKEFSNAELNNQTEKLLKKLLRTDLFVIDDFAFRKIDQAAAEFLYTIVDARYQTKSIILTSNRDIVDWLDIFPDAVTANAIMDRLAHNAHQIVIDGESYRKKFSPKIQNA
jgi:DNA replication protein DnaC